MGGKGKKRREKNYLAAHGGPARLPPPPDRSKQDALPSKLRILMNYTSPSPHDTTKQVVEKKVKNTKAEVEVEVDAAAATESDGDDTVVTRGDEKKKKKRKRNQMTDLRFEKELAELDGGHSTRKERKKKYWEAKKQKKNQVKTEDTLRENFPKHEQIRFGDVVQAPPKLAVVPKARKSTLSASQERQRLEAIDAYRSRKGWTERPGSQIPAVLMQ
ncbi:hypothetical protein CARUB_v10024041mg [Capsella rubella]|uniref:Uncharacterized protein n=1 Tax=Capsella rubella TaxID=81985 RepID=R0HM29_9BRAS|nr:uncharacterized protein LOC17887852 [Capsella rubella]EOA26285.1 hypothetical protein CARUB_v10024041mg [Capsella rubella]